jgi:hypothetical protein
MPAERSSVPPHAGLSRTRRNVVRGLLATATVLAVAAICCVWAGRQALDAGNWANTSSALLANNAIRTQVAGFLVDELYANVDVDGQVATALPPRLKPLAGPAANGLRDLAEKRANKALERPRVQAVWEAANRVTAQQVINVAEGKPGAISSSGNAVTLDVGTILRDVTQRLGLPASLANKVPPAAGEITVLSGNQVTTLQNSATTLRALSIVLPALVVALLASAVALSRGRRRRVLLFVGLDLIAAGVLALVARNVAGRQVVDSVAHTEAVKPAASAAWSIGTGMLRDVAQAAIVLGIPVIAAAWLAGPARAAVAFRRTAAPWLRDAPAATYAVAMGLAVLVIAWGPIPATREVVPMLLLIGLLILGVEALRRQTAVEFPDATTGDVGAWLRAGVDRSRHGAGQLLPHDRGEAAPAVSDADADAGGDGDREPTPPAGPDRVDQLERLSALHDSGALTDEEFASEKGAVLASGAPT